MIINPVQSKVAQWRIIFSCDGQHFINLHSCLEIHTGTKMVDLTKFCQTEWMLIDLTILANFLGKFVKTKSARRNWQILVKLIKGKSTQSIWQFEEFLPFLLLHAFLDITTLTNVNHMDLIKGGEFLRKLWCCTSGRGQQDNFCFSNWVESEWNDEGRKLEMSA